MEDIIIRFGLIAIFVGASIEGDVTLVLSGVTAHLRLLDLRLAMGVGAAGCFTGDFIWYIIGRWGSGAIQHSRVYRVVGPAVERVARRLGPWQILAARFVYGTRVATMLFWGVHRLSFGRFVLTDLAGCAAWAALLGTLGYAASSGATVVLGEVKRVEVWILSAVLVSVIVLSAVRFLYKRRQAQSPRMARGKS